MTVRSRGSITQKKHVINISANVIVISKDKCVQKRIHSTLLEKQNAERFEKILIWFFFYLLF